MLNHAPKPPLSVTHTWYNFHDFMEYSNICRVKLGILETTLAVSPQNWLVDHRILKS